MSFKLLLDTWRSAEKPELSPERYAMHLSADDAARVEALVELFPGTSAEQIIADLLHTSLDKIEAAMPYERGNRIIREDEFGDPVYEDAGLTPRFLELVRQRRN